MGVDIGSASHFVAVPPDRDDEPIQEFKNFTADLNGLADWLEVCEIDAVLRAYYRRLCTSFDKMKAITAIVYKLARLIYTMLTKGTKRVDKGWDYFEERCCQTLVVPCG